MGSSLACRNSNTCTRANVGGLHLCTAQGALCFRQSHGSSGSSLGQMVLEIVVSDPETHSGSSGSLSFVDFKVHTVTDDARYAARDFFVRRRYRDFVWLRSRLFSTCPGAIVPPLPPPDKPYKGELNRFSSEFVARRQAGLELFLRRVAAHSKLSSSTDLLTFLEAKVWELQTAKNASTASWVTSVLDSTDASMKRVTSALRTKVCNTACRYCLRP